MAFWQKQFLYMELSLKVEQKTENKNEIEVEKNESCWGSLGFYLPER